MVEINRPLLNPEKLIIGFSPLTFDKLTVPLVELLR
jgi:hypothetical protein